MMESSAVFFGLLFVWAMARLRSQPRVWVGLVAIVAAVLSAAIKVTSFFGFAAFVALAFLWLALHEHGWRPRWLQQHWQLLFWGGLSALAALATLSLWLQHADALKAQSALGRQITSDALSTWNYGTLQQRLDPATWWGTVFRSASPVRSAPTGSSWSSSSPGCGRSARARRWGSCCWPTWRRSWSSPTCTSPIPTTRRPISCSPRRSSAWSCGRRCWQREAGQAAPWRCTGDLPVRAVGGLWPGEVAEGHQGSARADTGFADRRGHPDRHPGAGRGGRVRSGLVLRAAVFLLPPCRDDSGLGIGRRARIAGCR